MSNFYNKKRKIKEGGYVGYWRTKDNQERLEKSGRKKYDLSYMESANRTISITSKDEETGFSNTTLQRLSIVTPVQEDPGSVQPPTKDSVYIFEKIEQRSKIQNVLRDMFVDEELLAVDLETKGVQAASGENFVAGIGIASETQCLYVDLLTCSEDVKYALYDWFLERRNPLLAYNLVFDGTWMMRETGEWLRWEADAYVMYRMLAGEGYSGQTWGLKDAQLQLLKWDFKGDVELNDWLVDNGHYTQISTENKSGLIYRREFSEPKEKKKTDPDTKEQYTYYDNGDRWLRPNKAEMWQAPASILGYYCGLDTISTLDLWNLVFKPSIKGQAWEESVWELHELFLRNIEITGTQQLEGSHVDHEGLGEYLKEKEEMVRFHKDRFYKIPEVAEYVEILRDRKREEILKKEPEKRYKNPPVLKEAPKQFKKDGSVSKNYLNWLDRKKMIEEWEPEETHQYKQWKDKLDGVETLDGLLNLNSPVQLQELFYNHLGYEIKVLTKTDAPSVGKKAFPHLGEPGRVLKNFKDHDKQLGFVKSTFENLLWHEEDQCYKVHPQFKVPGTLTLRLAGTGNLNVQQLPGDRGFFQNFYPNFSDYRYLDCFSEDTEILTKQDGWITFQELKDHHLVWQVDKDSFEGSWVKPSRIIDYEYEGDMYEIGNSRGKQLVTPNHKMLYLGQPSGREHKRRLIQKARDKTPHGVHVQAVTTDPSSKDTNYTDEEIWIACMLQADGSKGKKTPGTGYTIETSKPRKRDKIRELLKRDGRVTAPRKGQNLESETWCGIQYPYWDLLDPTDKSLNPFESLGANQVRVFLEALSFWDGYIGRRGSLSYGTTCKRTADSIQKYLTITCGIACRITSRKLKSGKTFYTLRIFSGKVAYRVNPDTDIKVVKYKGRVGCVTVPTGFITVRREGKVMISGQCDVNALEAVVMAELTLDPALLKLYGPEAHPDQDAYIFTGAHLPGLKEIFEGEGYDPNKDPDPEVIKSIKKKHKKARTVSKVTKLSLDYGSGVKALYESFSLSGMGISMEETEDIYRGYWDLYKTVMNYKYWIKDVWRENNGYVLDGFGGPVAIAEEKLHDGLNRVCQRSGHICQLYLTDITNHLLKENGVRFQWVIADWHDQLILSVHKDDAELAYHLVGAEAYRILNEEVLEGLIPLKGDPNFVDTIADAKVDAIDPKNVECPKCEKVMEGDEEGVDREGWSLYRCEDCDFNITRKIR